METRLPRMIYGTAWKKERTTTLVQKALQAGFRAIDTACQPKHYQEPLVGAGIAASGIPRESLFLQTKFTSLDGQDPSSVPYDPQAELEDQIRQSFQKSLQNLQTDYIDSYLLHSPMPTLEQTIQAWRVLEGFHDAKQILHLGLSNTYSLSFLKSFHAAVRVKPSFLQNRFYGETGWDANIRAWCAQPDINIRYQSFWTLTGNPAVLRSSLFRTIAAEKKCSVEQVLYKALVDSGVIPLNGTTSEEHMTQDLAVLDWPPWDADTVRQLLAFSNGN
ncbi:aldo/keto reductase [Phlyctochytrium arcticum]|nr:aldo/keto reductase [Phlyctochytrium arcticum]